MRVARPGERRVVLARQGTLGDLHPFLALSGALNRRGHRPLVAADPSHRARVEARGIEFRALRPDTAPVTEDPASMRRYLDPAGAWRGSSAKFSCRGSAMAWLTSTTQPEAPTCL